VKIYISKLWSFFWSFWCWPTTTLPVSQVQCHGIPSVISWECALVDCWWVPNVQPGQNFRSCCSSATSATMSFPPNRPFIPRRKAGTGTGTSRCDLPRQHRAQHFQQHRHLCGKMSERRGLTIEFRKNELIYL
jgi:hypothetical protein